MNPFDPDIFAAENPCVCCGTPSECACALLIPPFASPYADYATAEAAITDQVIDCMGYVSSGATGSIVRTANGFDAAASGVPTGMYVSVYAKAGTLTDNFTNSTGAMAISRLALYAEDGTELDSDVASGVSGTLSVDVPADGCYVVFVFGGNAPGDPPSSWTHSVTSSADFYVNPVIALWDDSGTTRQLEACPKMLLPPLTESTGDWYADCAEAASVLASNVSNCIGYTSFIAGSGPGDYDAYTWSISGSSSVAISADATDSDDHFVGAIGLLFSINAAAGETVSWPWTYNASGSPGSGSPGSVSMEIYSHEGTFIEMITFDLDEEETSASDTFVSAALPYTGRYIILIRVNPTFGPDGGGVNAEYGISGTMTSTGAMSSNPIQALYDAGLDCPGRLNCGDSCP